MVLQAAAGESDESDGGVFLEIRLLKRSDRRIEEP